MDVVFSKQGYPIGYKEPDRSYWAVKLKDPTEWVCEMDQLDDLQRGKRGLDWSLDIVGSGDWKRIVELWLMCPETPTSPLGNAARLPIILPGTAFQMKVAFMESNGANTIRNLQAQLIGRVTDVETGDCECFIYDYGWKVMSTPWKTNINRFGTWRVEVAPIRKLHREVVGIFLPDLEDA